MIDKVFLDRLQKKIDKLLDSETPESLNKWLTEYRAKRKPRMLSPGFPITNLKPTL